MGRASEPTEGSEWRSWGPINRVAWSGWGLRAFLKLALASRGGAGNKGGAGESFMDMKKLALGGLSKLRKPMEFVANCSATVRLWRLKGEKMRCYIVGRGGWTLIEGVRVAGGQQGFGR